MTPATFVLLAMAAVAFTLRIVRGPSLADRVIAVDGLLIVVVAGLAVDAARTDSPLFLNVAVVVALLGFVGTGVAARFIERRGA